jgi:hypothetical protein
MTFKDSLEDDYNEFFNTDEMAVSALIDGLPVDGIFDRPYIDTQEVSGYQPSLTCRSTDIDNVLEDDPVMIDGVSYRVSGVEPDGTGITKLILEKS